MGEDNNHSSKSRRVKKAHERAEASGIKEASKRAKTARKLAEKTAKAEIASKRLDTHIRKKTYETRKGKAKREQAERDSKDKISARRHTTLRTGITQLSAGIFGNDLAKTLSPGKLSPNGVGNPYENTDEKEQINTDESDSNSSNSNNGAKPPTGGST